MERTMTNMELEVLDDAELDQVTGGDTIINLAPLSSFTAVGNVNEASNLGQQVGVGVGGDTTINFNF
jgi:GTP cyclohydrolase III